MPQNLLIVNNPDRWPLDIPDGQFVAAKKYLTDPCFLTMRNCRVFNLCRSYGYQSLGYYVSLLAEARGHKPLPSAATIQDLKTQSVIKVFSEDLDELIQKSLEHLQSGEFELSIYFSRNVAERYKRLARELFNLFPAPLLRAYFKRANKTWKLQNVSAISAGEIPEKHRPYVLQLAREYFTHRNARRSKQMKPRYHMAILIDPTELYPPSDLKAIEKFERAAEKFGIDAEIIEKDDSGRLAEFDALFIRATTAVNNYTYRFARKAEAEGLVVMDDPTSIVRCTNKVYLAELLRRNNIPMPRTEILHRDNLGEALGKLGLPCVLKEPDSSFSQGVVKAESEAEYFQKAKILLEKSDLLIAQEYLWTEYDWRIGIVDQRAIYACRYFMARGHWQIYNHDKADKADGEGKAEILPVELAPKKVVQTALRAAQLMGDGLYGVDLKEVKGKCLVVEVNDNPSIDCGIEDRILRDALYERIMEVFLKRLVAKKEGYWLYG
jgi:glutathione synthase/RimK-type ligase-like ATP-grasp enzyme